MRLSFMLAALVLSRPAMAATYLQTFDTPTATTAATLATYGMQMHGNLSAIVADGVLKLDPEGGQNSHVSFAAVPGDLVFEFDAGISNTPGSVNVGYYSAGSHYVWIHPGYWGNYFSSGVLPSGNLGFTPDAAATHFRLAVTAATRQFDLTVSSAGHSFHTSYIDPLYEPGVTRLGFTVGAVVGAEFYGVFDNLSISTPVPEPASAWLLAGGLLALRRVSARRASAAA